MPRIAAETLAEHRAFQEEALLEAAERILLADGFDALSFGRLGEETGLARNSVYRYFASTDDLLAALCERGMPDWLRELELAITAVEGLEERVEAFVETQLRLVGAGRHRLADVLATAPLGPQARARINALSYAPAQTLERMLRDAGCAEPEVTAQLVQGLISAAVRMLHRGGDAGRVAQTAKRGAVAIVADRSTAAL
jgi:AcrR family transcriptional regulator